MWKRENARLTYEWDVDTFDDTEPDRPQFYGTKTKPVSIVWAGYPTKLNARLKSSFTWE